MRNALFALVSLLALPLGARAQDEAARQALEFARSLKGIERHFMFVSAESPDVMVQKALLLMEHRKQPVPDSIRDRVKRIDASGKNPFNFFIDVVDARAGYLALQCKGCEVAIVMTYWSARGQPDLVAITSTSCGPFCDSSIEFFRVKDDRFLPLKNDDVIGTWSWKDFLIDKEKAAVFKDEPIEFVYRLPRQGTSIMIVIDAENGEYFKGNKLELKWNNGTFKPGQFSF